MKKIYLFIGIVYIAGSLLSCSEDKNEEIIEEFVPQTFTCTASFNVKEGEETEITGTKTSVPTASYDHDEIILINDNSDDYIRIDLSSAGTQNLRDYTFSFTTLPDNKLELKIGTSETIVVSHTDDLYFASHTENDCDFCLEVDTKIATPAGGIAYASYSGPSNIGGNKLYRTANFNIYVNNDGLNIVSKQYADIILNNNNEASITVYRSTGILTTDVILFEKTGDKEIVDMGSWDGYLSGEPKNWTVTPYITNYPRYFDITLPTAGAYKLQGNENVAVALLNEPNIFEAGSFNYVISSTEGASNIQAYGTKTTVTPWLFNGSLNNCTLKLYIKGLNDDEEFIASKTLEGNTLLTNDIKRFYLYINVSDLMDDNNKLRTTSFGGKQIKQVPISFFHVE